MTDDTNQLLLSAAVVWEIAVKRSLGKLAVTDEYLPLLLDAGVRPLPINLDHALPSSSSRGITETRSTAFSSLRPGSKARRSCLATTRSAPTASRSSGEFWLTSRDPLGDYRKPAHLERSPGRDSRCGGRRVAGVRAAVRCRRAGRPGRHHDVRPRRRMCDAGATARCARRSRRTPATEIQLPHDLYSLEDDPLVISRPLTIRGIQDELAVISANPETQDRVITIAPEISVQLFRLRIEGGNEEDLRAASRRRPGRRPLRPGQLEPGRDRQRDRQQPRRERRRDLERRAADAREDDRRRQHGLGRRRRTSVSAAGSASRARRRRRRSRTRPSAATTPRGLGGGIFTQRSMTLRNVSIVEQRGAAAVRRTRTAAACISSSPPGSDPTTATNTLVALNVNGGCGGTQNFPIDSNNGLLDELDRPPDLRATPTPATTSSSMPAPPGSSPRSTTTAA